YANDKRLLFKDTTAPTVVDMQPADGAKQVDANEIPLVLFSETIRPSSLSAADGLTLTRVSTGDKAVGTFTIAGSAVAFAPGAAMVRGEAYKFRAGTGITDLAGHALAAAKEVRFTVAAASTVAPTLDPLPPVVCAPQLVVAGTAPPNAAVRVRDGSLSFTGNADSAGRFAVTIPLSGNGWHAVHAAVIDSGGTPGPEAAALFRMDCSAPAVAGATFDRATGKITVAFTEAMTVASLTLGGAGSAITVSKADDATNAPQAATLSLSTDGLTATLDVGSGASAWWANISVRLFVGPPAADAVGNAMTAPFSTVFFAGGGGDLSGGFLSGAALDEESGRPLAGADARLFASGAALPGAVLAGQVTPPIASTVTDGRGRFSLTGDIAAGRYALVLSRTGYTRVVRRLALEPAVGAVPFGSRLTTLAAQAPSLLAPASGGSFAGPAGSNATVDFAANALAAATSVGVRLTPLSGQGLPEPLPLGWTPLAAAELRLIPNGAGDDALPEGAGTPFTPGGVTVTLPLPPGIVTADLYAARYDVVAGAWLALPLPVFVAGSGSIPDRARVALAGPGSVALIAPDANAATRPAVMPVSLDAPLVGVDLPATLPVLTATIALDPPIVSPTGRATARVVARSSDGTTPWPSGLAVQGYLDEKLILSGGGGELYEAPFSADLVLYHPPLSAGDLGGAVPGAVGTLTFRISPSPRAAQVLLDTGYENVRLFPFTDQLERGQVLGPAGGSVSTADGVELVVPESGLAQKTVVNVHRLSAAELSALPPVAGYTTVAGVRVSLSGAALARAATLRLNAPTGLPVDAADDPRYVLAAFVDSPDDGRGAFANAVSRVTLLPAAGAVPARLVAAPEASGSPLPFPGLAGEGVFLYLHANAPVGFVTGRVTAPNGAGIAGSRVTAAGLGTANLSVPGGVYAVPAPAGSPTLNALHPVLGVAGSGQVPSLAKGQVATLDLVLSPVPPQIRALQPANGAADQPVGSTVAVAFSAALDPASVNAATLTVELANSDGTGTGLLLSGSVSLSPDKTTIVFGPGRPLPPGRTIRATFKAGVRGADGTSYAGALPVAWSFKTSTQFVAGGAIHPEKIRLLLPLNGVAQIVGADGALPLVTGGTTPWSAWADADGALACPSITTTPANANGGFTLSAGCPPTARVTIASKVYIHILDPTGTEAATFKLGPFLTADGTGFVAPPRETTVVTTSEGIEVTSPAAAFDVPTLVTVKKLDPSTLGVPIQQGMEIGAYVNVDFDGTANETIRLRIPTTASAPVGSLVFAGTPVDMPWGRKLQMLDLGRVVAGPSGQKLISNLEEDQPTAPAAIATASGGRAALAQRQPEALRQCRFTDKKTGDIFFGPCPLLRNIFAEFTARGSGVFISGASAELAAIMGQAQIFEIGKQFEVLYNFYADTFVYLPPAQDWDGNYILPVVVGAPLRVVVRDRAAGWIRAEQDFAAVTGGAGTIIKVAEFPPGASRPPSILDGAPFAFSRFHAPLTDSGLSCLALRLEVQGCSTGLGTALLRATGGSFLLAEAGQVELFNLDAGNRSGAATVDRFGVFPDLTVPAKGSDELMAVLTPGDLDPAGLSELSFNFDQALLPIADLTTVAKLFDCGLTSDPVCANAPVPVESIQSAAGDRLSIVPAGTLPYGHRFRIELNPGVIQVRGASGPIGYPGWAPAAFVFATRNPANGPIGSLPNPTDPIPSLGDTDSARDLLKFGNLLMVASAGARILAIDVSDPARPKRFAMLNNGDKDVRSFATDGHNRLFYNFVGASTWGVGAIRIEDVRHASPSACRAGLPAWASGISCFDRVLGGVRTAFALGFGDGLTGSDFLSLAGSLPTGTPTSMQVLVEDAAEDDKELKDFYDSHWGTGGFDLLTPDADGFYTFKVTLDTKGHLAQRGQTCSGENPWDHFQRVTIDDVTTAQSWSFDVENPWPGNSSANGTLTADGIRARRGDRLRVRYNLRALGYLAIVGSGISVVDLNRFYRTPLSSGVGTGGQNNLGECGRRLGKLEGQDVVFPKCAAPGPREVPPPDKGIALTSDLVVLPAPDVSGGIAGGAAGGIGIFSALRNFGAVQSGSPDDNPGAMEIGSLQCLRGLGSVWLRSVALAEGVSYQYENNSIDLSSGSVIKMPGKAYMREGRTLVFYSLGDPGILVTDVTDGWMDPIGLLTRAGHSVYRLQADVQGGRLFAGATRSNGGPVIDVWNLAAVNEAPQSFGSDPRFLLSVAAPWDTNHVALDETGTGLLYTWGQGTAGRQGGLAIPIESPKFVYAGVFLDGQNGVVSGTPKPVVRIADRLYPLGVPTRIDPKDEVDPTKRNESQQKATAAFKVRLALPGGLGIPESDLDEITAKVQTLRVLPDNRLLAQENLGRAVAVPGGSAWPARDVFVRLKRVGKAAKFDGPQDTGENGRFATVYNLYESQEVVLLVADPRARKDYRGGAEGNPASAISSERLQCRRCDRPAYLGAFADADIKELLAGGPYVRAFLAVDPDSPATTRDKTQKVLDFFADPAIKANYSTPIGTEPVAAWADSVPSAVQVSQAEPAQNAAAFSPGEAGVNVSMVSGEVVLRATDHTTMGRGMAFLFDRTYRSGTAGYGPLGAAGWGANLFAHLRVLPPIEELSYSGEIEYHDGSGNVFRFYPPKQGLPPQEQCPPTTELDTAGSFCVTKGLYVRLIQLEAGKGWRLLDRQHGMLSFDANGRLFDGSDRFRQGQDDTEKQGNTLKFGYDGFGFLVHVEDDLGRPYRFIYRDDPVADGPEYGLLISMKDFDGREAKYEYDTGHERLLTGVTFPGVTNPFYPEFGAPNVPTPKVTYTYADPVLSPNAPLHEKFGKLRLNDFTLPGGAQPRAAFGFEPASGRVSEVRFPTGGPSKITWALTDYQGPPDQALSGASVIAPWGHRTDYAFDHGRIATKTQILPHVRPVDGTEVIATTVTQHTYSDDGRPLSVTWPDSSITTYCYADVGPGTCAKAGGGDLLSRPNVLGISRARGSAPKDPAVPYDAIETTMLYGEDNVIGGATDPLGRPITKAVPTAGGSAPSGYHGEGVYGSSVFDNRGRLTIFQGGTLPNGTPPIPLGPNGEKRDTPLSMIFTYEEAKSSPNYGRLIHMTKGAVSEGYIYDSVGNLTQKTTSYGATSTMSYDEWDRQIQSTEGISANSADPSAYPPVPGVVTHRAFDPTGHLVRERRNQDPLGWVEVQYIYNAREQLLSVYQTQLGKSTLDGSVDASPILITQNEYDPVSGLIVSSTSAEGTVTHYGYDSAGRLATTQTGIVPAQLTMPQSTGGLKRQAYDVMGRVALTTDGDRGVWRGKYDAWGRLYEEVLPTGSVLERQHDKAGNVVRETFFDGDPEKTPAPAKLTERWMTVNAFGAATEIRELLKPGVSGQPGVIRLTKRTYDTNGRVVAEQSGPDGGLLRREASFEYQADTGRLVKRIDGAGNETDFTYGQASEWPTKTSEKETVPGKGPLTDANWVETQRDLLGRVVEVKMRGGQKTTTRYDQAGNVVEATTGAGSTTSAKYDGRGSVLRVDRPNGRGVTFFGLDRDGRVVQRRSVASGQRQDDTFYRYDNPTGRLIKITRPDSTSEAFTYNPDDTLDVWTTRSGVAVKHFYDDANRLLARVPSAAPGGGGLPVVLDSSDSYAYDAASRLTGARRLTLGAGSAVAPSSVAYEDYDTGGRPGRETLGEAPVKRDPLLRSYDIFDRSVGMSLPAGVGRASAGSFLGYGQTYDDLDRTTSLCGDPTLVAQVACGAYPGAIGAKFAWGGAARLYGVTTRGPLKTAHRFGYISGPGAQPPPTPDGDVGNEFRLGTLTVGSTQQDAVTFATQPMDASWGGLGFGYRAVDGVKLGRKVLDLAASGVGGDPNTLSLLSNEGWTWVPDLGLRLKEARPGLGRLDKDLPVKGAFDVFGYGYGTADEIKSISREATGTNDLFDLDVEGRIAARDGSPFHYDAEGRRQEDDRFFYKWSWRGELLSVTVKPTRPDGSVSPYAGQQIRYDYDAIGRLLSRTHVGELPSGETDESKRPFIEKRRYLWDGSTLLSETAYAQDRPDGSEGPLRWRKSYVPGASGLDDAVEVRVETYDGAGADVLTEKLYSYLRDEQGTVTGIVEEKDGADPKKPPVLVRYLYDPYGQAHAELGEELYRATYDKTLTSVTTASGPTATQTPTATAVSGALTLLFSEPIDLTTLSAITVERRLTDGTWGALTAAELAIGRDPTLSESLVILPLNGWEKSAFYRIRLTSALLATDGRGLPGTMTLQIEVPATGDLIYDVPFPILYDNVFASGNDLKGAFPGGSNALFQGLWTDPVTGIAFARARWYDARNASFLQEDPEDDRESLNLYAFVGMRPNELTDPMGLLGLGDWLGVAGNAISGTVSDTLGLAGKILSNPRVAGTLQALAGVAEVTAGTAGLLAPEPTGATKVFGAVALVHGIDDIAAGLKTAISGKQTDTLTKRGIQKGLEVAGVSADTADKIATGVDLGIGIFAPMGALKGAGAARGAVAAEGAETRMANKLATAEREGAELAAGETRLGKTVNAALREDSAVAREARAVSGEAGAERSLLREAEGALGCRCFAAGTLVATEQGEKRIEAIEPGDRVVAYDPATATMAFDEVQAGFLRLADRSVVVTVAGEQIFTTEEHPFFVVGKDWVRAEELKAGDRLLTITGKWLPVERIDIRETPTAVFNLMVAEAHTYYAGKSQVLVHNACGLKGYRSKIEGRAQKTGTPGHQFRTYREAIAEARNPDVVSVHMNHGYNRGLQVDPATIASNRRPDVLSLYKDNSITRIEVQSKTDVPAILASRNAALDAQLKALGFKPRPPRVIKPR
ncbi:MAG: Ig-like domain-containing protein, partial [Acidobacteriota bacterium]